jgi:hypothetical protein
MIIVSCTKDQFKVSLASAGPRTVVAAYTLAS